MSVAMEAGHKDIGVILYKHLNFSKSATSPGVSFFFLIFFFLSFLKWWCFSWQELGTMARTVVESHCLKWYPHIEEDKEEWKCHV